MKKGLNITCETISKRDKVNGYTKEFKRKDCLRYRSLQDASKKLDLTNQALKKNKSRKGIKIKTFQTS